VASPHTLSNARNSRRGFKAMVEQDGKKQFNISERLEDLRR